MFCYNCGNKLQEEASVCEKCGAPVVSAEEVVEETLTPPTEAAETEAAEPVYTAPQYQEVPAKNTNGNAYSILALIFSLLSFLLCIVPLLMLGGEILAIIFSILGIKRSSLKGMAITALVFAIISLVVTLLMTLVLVMVLTYGFSIGGIRVFF